jgi:hypothetical protein
MSWRTRALPRRGGLISGITTALPLLILGRAIGACRQDVSYLSFNDKYFRYLTNEAG